MNEPKIFTKVCADKEGKVHWKMEIEVKDFGSFVLMDRYYLNEDGSRRNAVSGKGVRHTTNVKTSSKGRYFVVSGERYYL